MKKLLSRFKRDLALRGLSDRTQDHYFRNINQFLYYYNLSADQFDTEKIRDYLYFLITERKSSDSKIRQALRIAISNYHIVKVENDTVHFWYKDYKENNFKKVMILPVLMFMKRFMLHVVPSRFTRIRYYGLLANKNKKNNLKSCYEYFQLQMHINEISKGADDLFLELTGIDIHKCPKYGFGELVLQKELPPIRYHSPPVISA